MIDVVFLLLTFFVFALILTVRMDVSDIRLPEARSGEPAERVAPVVLALTEAGELRLDTEPVAWADLSAAVRALLAERPDARLFVAADREAPAGRLFELIDLLKAAGQSDIRFLRDPTAGP
jgi:biopolymer transport protein ExbD